MSASAPSSAPPPGSSTAPPPSAAATPPPQQPASPPPSAPPASSTPPPSAPPTSPSPNPNPPPPLSKPPPDASSPPPADAPPSPDTPVVTPPTSAPPTVKPAPPSHSTPPTRPSPPSDRVPPGGGSSRPSLPSPPASNSSSGGTGISTSLVVGVAVGGLVVLLLASILCACCWRKRRRQPPSPPYKDEQYIGRVQQNWQQNAPTANHAVQMAPLASPPQPFASRPPYNPYPVVPPPPFASRPPHANPSPVPHIINSSGGSGSNHSAGELLPPPPPPPPPVVALGFSKNSFSYEELVKATDGFSDANLLGQGGFGFVHRGVLPNGKEIAVKQLKAGSGQGEREFQAEVEIISRVHHKHLVSLVGYCISGGRRLLVYEFVPNNTLEFHLHGKGRPTMEWPMRMKIALGAAKGLAYLHEDCHPKIIHRDIKGSNILLDYKFEAKVSDFGLAKFTSDNNTHVSTRVMGTFGYLAPEYASSGKLTDKSDVFSFGVMLLELITGRRPVDLSQIYMEDSLVDWARPLLTRALDEGDYEDLVDPRLGKDYDANEMARMIACAAACVRHSARRRPRMGQVVRALEGDVSLDDLNEGVVPGHSRFVGSYTSSDYDSGQYIEEMKKFKKVTLQSKDYQSSQYSAPTSEYGLVQSASSSEEGQQISSRDKDAGKSTREGNQSHGK